jgi:hypothetical protein
MHLVRFVLLTCGLSYVVTQSSPLGPLRVIALKLLGVWGALFYCMACTGFWVGLGLDWAGLGPPWASVFYHIDAGLEGLAFAVLFSPLTDNSRIFTAECRRAGVDFEIDG